MKLACLAVLCIAFLANHCFSQKAEKKTGNQEPPKLELAFSDDFSRDTRDDYTIAGDVAWEPGKLKLAEGASIVREINGGPWAELELDFQFPDLTEDGQESDLRIWFDLGDGATDCYVRLWQQRLKGKVSSEIGLYDTDGQYGDSPTAKLVRLQSTEGPLVDGRWQLKYRNGLVTATGTDLFSAYVSKGVAQINWLVFESETRISALSAIKVFCSTATDRKYSDKEKKQLSFASQAESDSVKLTRKQDYEAAAELAEEVLRIRMSILGGNHPAIAASLSNLAYCYWQRGKYARAESLYRQSLKVWNSAVGENHPESASSQYNLAWMYRSQGNYIQALPLSKQVVEIWKSVLDENHADYATSLDSLARLYSAQGNYALAVPLFEQVSRIRKLVHGTQHRYYAISLNSLAEAYHGTGEYARAELLFKQVLEVRQSESSYAVGLNNLAAMYLTMGDYARAEPLLKQSIELKKSVHGEEHLAYAAGLNNLAELYVTMGDYALAEPLYKQSLEIRETALGKDRADYARSLLTLGSLYVRMKDYERAEPLCRQAVEILKSTLGKNHPDYAKSLNNLAWSYRGMGEYARAEPLCKRAMEIVKSALGENHPAYSSSLNNVAFMYKAKGDYARAEPLYKQSVEIVKSALGEEHLSYANSLIHLAYLYQNMGDNARAEPPYKEAVGIVRRMLDANSLIQSDRQQKRNQTELRQFLDWRLSNSLGTNIPAIEVLEPLWQWKGAVTLQQKAYREVSANSNMAPLFKSLQSVSRQLSAAAGQKPMTPSKLADPLKHTNYDRRLEIWETRFAKLTRQREDLEQQIAAESEGFRVLLEPLKVTAVQDVLPVGTAFVDFLEYSHPASMPNHHGQINWHIEPRYIAFVVTKDRKPVMIELGSERELSKSIIEYRNQFVAKQNTTAGRKAAATAGINLREQLWVPIEKHLDGINTVIVSPDTALGTLPWAALPGREANSFLLEDYKLASVPFANLLPRLMHERPSTSKTRGLLVLGDVDYDSDPKTQSGGEAQPLLSLASEQGRMNRTRGEKTGQWKSLPGFRKELETVKSLHQKRFGSDSQISTLAGTEATEESFLEIASGYDTLHLITHGFFEDPSVKSIDQAEFNNHVLSSQSIGPDPFINTWMPGLLSGLVLAGANRPSDNPEDLNDGILRASEIETASLSGVDLVVLSACETGLGAIAGGEGLTGLRRSFHIAGARSVVASLWKVEDRATQELMRRFYENLWIKNMSKIDALREAQLWMLRHLKELEAMGIKNAQTRGKPRDLKPTVSRPNTNARTDPYYWAAFQLSGDWR